MNRVESYVCFQGDNNHSYFDYGVVDSKFLANMLEIVPVRSVFGSYYSM